MESLKKLSDHELLKFTARIAQQEREITVNLLQHLQEGERRQLFLDVGYPTLYEYVVKELKFSEGAAYRRIGAMRLVREVPSAAEKLESGKISLCTAAKVQSATKKTPSEDKEKILESVAGKSSRETDRELSKYDPKLAKESTRWINENEVQLSFSLEKLDFQKMQELQSIRSHRDVQKTYRILVTDLVKLGQEKWNPFQRNATSKLKSRCNKEDAAWKTIPPSLRREIWTRDKGVCTFKVPGTDKICGSKDLVQLDHIHPIALGGKNEVSNLRLLCAAHNRARAEKTFDNPFKAWA
jgi:5-methylcytosine-specific restriction endonuclease McrA